MNDRAIHISSVKREKKGTNKPNDFSIYFNPPLKLNPEQKHYLALDRLSTTYSWYNIRDSYKNNKLKYSNDGGTSWHTITFTDGMHSYSDINDYIHQFMVQKSHHTTDSKGEKVYSINITFILSTYRILITVENNFQLDISEEFGDLIGFDKKKVTKTEYGTKLPNPNITNSIDSIESMDSLVDGKDTNTLAVIPTDNLSRSQPFTCEPRRILFSPVSFINISEMRYTVTDSLQVDRPLDLNGMDWHVSLILRSLDPDFLV